VCEIVTQSCSELYYHHIYLEELQIARMVRYGDNDDDYDDDDDDGLKNYAWSYSPN